MPNAILYRGSRNLEQRSMFVKMRELFPIVTPSRDFSLKLWNLFEQWDDEQPHLKDNIEWADRMDQWLATNIGLAFDEPDVAPWVTYRVLDPQLFTMALLRYS